MKTWYEVKTGNHQGLIIEENSGDNIAVAYRKEDACLIASAPDLLKACKLAYESSRLPKKAHEACINAIAKAEGGYNE